MSTHKSDSLTIKFLQGNDTIVLEKPRDSRVFIATSDSFIVSRGTLILILKHLVEYDILSPAILEGILEEEFTK